MVEDYVVIRADDKMAYADPAVAQSHAETLCEELRQPVFVYMLVGVAKPKKVWPVQFTPVKKAGKR